MAISDELTENIRSIQELVDAGLRDVPASYIRPLHERAGSAGDVICRSLPDQSVPIISLNTCTPQLLSQVAHACSHWGIFQITNHGLPATLQKQLWNAASHFFSLPTDVKLALTSQDPARPLVFSTGFSRHEKVKEWKDMLGFKPSPAMDDTLLPFFLREPMLSFHRKMTSLADTICDTIRSSLALDCKDVFHALVLRATMGFNYYPACPNPDLTFGLSSHSDFGSITIIMHDDVKGLQVRQGDSWIDVLPVANSFTVILGDQLEILTNGYYKSVEHRVLTNRTKARMSIACFYGPQENKIIKPLAQFITHDRQALYREIKFSDYLEHAFGQGLNGKSQLQFSHSKSIPS